MLSIGLSGVVLSDLAYRLKPVFCRFGQMAGLSLLWEEGKVGQGYSSLAISEGRIFTMGDKDGSSHLFALKLEDGSSYGL